VDIIVKKTFLDGVPLSPNIVFSIQLVVLEERELLLIIQEKGIGSLLLYGTFFSF
jgi:hypothetical protein